MICLYCRGKSAHGIYGDEVEELDWSIGQILEELRDLNLTNNTLVYVTSDNGAHIEEQNLDGVREGGYNGVYRGNSAKGFSFSGGSLFITDFFFCLLSKTVMIFVPYSYE